MRPFSRTTIWSACRTVDSRWAAMITVRPSPALRRLSTSSFSVSLSTALSASSRIRTRGLRASARAMQVRCRCPPERVTPRSPMRCV